LNSRVIFALFHFCGTTPSAIDLLYIKDRSSDISLAISFKNSGIIPSSPGALPSFNLIII